MKIVDLFFPTEKGRDGWMKNYLSCEIPSSSKEIATVLPKGIRSVKLRKRVNRIPGYWVRITFDGDNEGLRQIRDVENSIPSHWIGQKVYFPKEAHNIKEMETNWIAKYNLNQESTDSDGWRVFFKEIQEHFYQERMEVVSVGLMYIYKNNPYFLKKYKRFYMFEDLAYYYEAKGELHKSIKYLRVQASLQPDSSEAYLNMSSFLILNGLSAEAIEVCLKGLKINMEDEYLNNNLLIAYLNEGYYEMALEHQKKIIDMNPNRSTNWKYIGDVFSEMGEDIEAIKHYQKALEINSSDIHDIEQDIYYGLAICYQQMEDFKEAIKYYHKMLRYNNADPKVLLNLSKIYGDDLKKYDKAQLYAEKIVKLFPQNGYGHHNLGLVYLYTGRLDSAKWHLYQARRLIPDYQPVHDAILELKRIKKNPPTAYTSQ